MPPGKTKIEPSEEPQSALKKVKLFHEAPVSNRVTAFRAKNITLQDGVSLSQVIDDIISNNTGGLDEAAFDYEVQDITPRDSSNLSSTIRSRGTALITFRGQIPHVFRDIKQKAEIRMLSNAEANGASMEVDPKFIGTTVVYQPPVGTDVIADIVAIHGLNSHPYGSWLSKSESPQMWLKDFLPEDAPNCRIILYGYDSNIFGDKEHPRLELFNQAEILNTNLTNIRNGPELTRRPIIFLAHSFGGLVLARALIVAAIDIQKKPIHDATIGLFLFASPARGFHVQDILDAMQATQAEEGQNPMSEDKARELVQRLGRGDFRNELALFPNVVREKKVYTFVEMRQTQTLTLKTGQVRRDGEPIMAAGPNSVILGLPSDVEEVILTDKDHSNIVKFAMRSDDSYENVRCRIQSLLSAIHRSRETRAIPSIISDHLAATQSQSLDPGPHWIVPFSRNSHFVGREQELSTLRRWASSEASSHNMAVFGLGGVGKTQIALEFAYCTRDQNPSCSVFWVPATDHLAFEQAYKQIGQMLNIPGIDANGADIKHLVKEALDDNTTIGPWLMIVDNADDINMVFRQPTDDESMPPPLIEHIPLSPKGSILLTTRNRRVAVKQASDQIIFLEIMGPEDSNKLLRMSLLRQEILSDTDAAKELLGLLGFLPLAIIQAAAYINENDTTIREYTSLYNDNETEVMEVLSEDFEVHGRYKTTKNSIAATWLISLSQLARTNPVAISFLSLMACLSCHNTSQSLLPPAPSKKQGLEAIGALKAYSFIRKREDDPSFDMHPLVHLAMRNWLRDEKKLQLWTSNAVLRLVDLLPDGGHENRTTWTAYLPHAKYLLSSATTVEGEVQVVVLAEKLSKCLYSNGEFSEALQEFRRALELRVKVSSLENRDALRSMFGIAESLRNQGKHRQAESQHREILELRKKVLGPRDHEVGRSMNYLAQAMYLGGKYVEAEQMHRDALALQNEVLHPEHPNALTTTGYLAQTLSQQGKYVEAEEMHRNLLQTRLRVMGGENPATLATMSCLGVAQADLGEYSAAERTHRQVLDLRVRILGNRHPHTLITKRWLAETLVQRAKYEEAYALNRETLELQTELLGVKHRDTLLTLGNLGDIFYFQGQKDRAEKVYRQVLERQTDALGPEHPETLVSMNSLAHVLSDQGKHDEAEDIYAKVLEARVRVLGPQHPNTLATHSSRVSNRERRNSRESPASPSSQLLAP